MKRKKVKMILRSMAEGAVLGVLVVGIVAGAVRIRAAGVETELQKEYMQYCEEIGEEYAICPELLMAIMEMESEGDAYAVGKYGEVGLMQIYPKWHIDRARELGIYDLFDPKGNIEVAADYLVSLFEQYGDIGTVLMVYNGTSDATERGEKGEYTEYAKRIMNRAEQLERLHKK